MANAAVTFVSTRIFPYSSVFPSLLFSSINFDIYVLKSDLGASALATNYDIMPSTLSSDNGVGALALFSHEGARALFQYVVLTTEQLVAEENLNDETIDPHEERQWVIVEEALLELLGQIRARQNQPAVQSIVCRGCCCSSSPVPYCLSCLFSSPRRNEDYPGSNAD